MSTALRNFVDGELVDASEGATRPVLDPVTGEGIARAPDSGANAGKPIQAFRDDAIPSHGQLALTPRLLPASAVTVS
jgi:acyl-CoA reductase-like NAD-dependent aldehyde dehydrogenase